LAGPKTQLYRTRMRDVVKYIQELKSDTQTKTADIATKLGLSPRMVSRYLSDLEKLKLISRLPDGDIILNMDYVHYFQDSLGYKPKQLTLDDFMIVIDAAESVFKLRDQAVEILRKLKTPLKQVPNLRDGLLVTSPKALTSNRNLIGDKLLYRNYVSDSLITSNILGIAGASRRTLFRIDTFICTYIACSTAAAWHVTVDKGRRLQESNSLYRPDLREIGNSDVPFHELFTEFSGLRKVGYGLVQNYLAQTNLYRLGMEALKKNGDKIEIFFRLGSLLPHGFLSPYSDNDRAFRKLKFEFQEVFSSFQELAKQLGIIVCGVAIDPRDDWFSTRVCRNMEKTYNELQLRDNILLSMVMHERDATCLINRQEQGKIGKDFYEFYLKNQNVVTKYEFLRLDGRDPMDLQARIADVAYNTSSPYPHRFIPSSSGFGGAFLQREQLVAPFVAHEASYDAILQLNQLMKSTKVAFDYGFEKLLEEIHA
jgi:DNA-binding Lrp family transcriptional regulator